MRKTYRTSALPITAFLLLVAASQIDAPSQTAAQETSGIRQIVAHRGSSADRPECTLASVRRAIEAGATAVEVDVRMTKDRHLVILHDATLDRTTSGTGPVGDKDLSEIKKLDAGSWFDATYKNEQVPTLFEVLEISRDKIDVLLDLKQQGDDFARAVAMVVQSDGQPSRTIVGVRSVAQARLFRNLLPASRQLGLIGSPDDIEAYAEAGVDTIRLWPRWLTDQQLPSRVREAGATLHLNGTTGTDADVAPLLKYQPFSLSSDDPGQLVKSLDQLRARQASDLWNWMMTQARGLDYDQLPDYQAIRVLLSIAAGCDKFKRHELAGEFMQRALAIAERDESHRHYSQLFEHAVEINRLDLAAKFANLAGRRKDSLLDRLDVAKYRRGDRAAVHGYPREEMTFYNALELAEAYVDAGEYRAAEDFVTGIIISEENDPRAVTGITLQKIAKRYREKGDLENARRYIDKSVAVGGNLFYTGYALRVAHRSIHGVLTEDLDEFAQRGANYRGHMGRELVMSLIRELRLTGHFEEAKRTTRFLDRPEDVDASMQYLAIEQAKQGAMDGAFQTVEEIEDFPAQALARSGIAQVLWQSGEKTAANQLVDAVYRETTGRPAAGLQPLYLRLARQFGLRRSQAELEELIHQASEPLAKANRVVEAIQGFAQSQVEN